MTQVIIGVDIGTTNLKAVAFSASGQQLAKSSVPTPTDYPQADWAQFDTDALWNGLVTVIRGVNELLNRDQTPAAIAFTGMAEAGVPIDAKGHALYPAITWYDRRILPQLEKWQAEIGAETTARITGLPVGPAAGILRLLWLRDNEPDVFNRMETWLNLPDWAAFKLCGTRVTEYSLASRMMTLDLETKDWSDEILNAIDIDRSVFGTLAQSGVQIGELNADMSKLTGLPKGLPVCTGGHDHLCAAVGLGVTDDGDIFDSIGTAEAIVAALPMGKPNLKTADMGIARGLHVLPDRHYAITGNALGGGSIDWARRLLYGAINDPRTAFETLVADADAAPAGSGGVFVLPHLRGGNPPILDPGSRGAFLGVSSDTTTGDMARAVLEGLAYEFQNLLSAVSKAFDAQNTGLIASGGGTRNSVFMQIKADVSGLPITVPEVEEATCLGAAIAAGIGIGIFDSFEAAYGQFTLSKTVYSPDKNNHDFYRDQYDRIFTKIYPALKTLNHNISESVHNGNKADSDE